ncbi:very short patch repair endonuclease [Nocardioides sp. Root151]|uniref:very short patch repair endonuclease n=1 Tax=Nocardioides sp. Root151 TaxID=1736475 RepID=UPI002AA2A461|nr:very short patch repair endonuclease [Nocardioides sp. Root151]
MEPIDETVRARMRTQRRADTKPEMELRRELHRRGLRYRVGHPVPGVPRRTIDIAFTRVRLAVFVDGCYWHRCPIHSVPAKNNGEWWASKLQRNHERDQETNQLLGDAGWAVLRIWEHEGAVAAADTVTRVLNELRT